MPTDGRTRLSMPALAPGVRLNDTYEIDAHVATGGMGNVYRGHNIETGEPVAIKRCCLSLPATRRCSRYSRKRRRCSAGCGTTRSCTTIRFRAIQRSDCPI